MHALCLASLEEILARALERGFHPSRAARSEVHLVERPRRAFDQARGQRLHRLVAEEGGMRERQRLKLARDRLGYRAVGVAEAGNGGAARGVEIAPPVPVVEIHA